jgi:hypothetical protein
MEVDVITTEENENPTRACALSRDEQERRFKEKLCYKCGVKGNNPRCRNHFVFKPRNEAGPSRPVRTTRPLEEDSEFKEFQEYKKWKAMKDF